MSLPILTALFAIVIGSSTIGILSGAVAVPEVTGVVAVMLGLGVGIDYALFILSRHRHHLASGEEVPVAIGRANATAGLSVLFAGLTVIVAIMGLKVSGVPMMEMMGYGSAIMVAVVMLASITLLPAILGVVKHRVNSARVPFVRPRQGTTPTRCRPAGRLASWPGPCGTAEWQRSSSGCSPSRCSPCTWLRRRRQRRTDLDHPQGLRPHCRRIRP